jgi:hypothetical protein
VTTSIATSNRDESLPHEASLSLGIIAFHLAVAALHGAAHFHYEIPLAMWQHVYVAAIVFVAPLAAGGLLLARRLRAGAWLMLISMAAAALFGIYFHFLLIGPDNVSSINLDAWGMVFFATSIFLAATEVWGVSVSFRLLRAARRHSAQAR